LTTISAEMLLCVSKEGQIATVFVNGFFFLGTHASFAARFRKTRRAMRNRLIVETYKAKKCQDELNSITELTAVSDGFMLAARLMIEVLQEQR